MHNIRAKNVLNARCVVMTKQKRNFKQEGVTNLREGGRNDKTHSSGDRNLKMI